MFSARLNFLSGNAAARCDCSHQNKIQLEPYKEKIKVKPDSYAVASTADNKALEDAQEFPSEAAANEFMKDQLAADPNLADDIHVIPSHELSAAA